MSAPEIKVSKQLREIASELDKRLESTAGQKIGFSLLVFNTSEGSRMNYVSNCDRESVVNAMQSLLNGWDQGMTDIKAHEIS